jgi:hypothetical protein
MPKQDVAVELFYNGVWNNLTASDDVFADTPIVITRGDGAESAAPRPANISLRLANDDDSFRTSNPLSPLYGNAGVNTPLRVSVAGKVRGWVEASSWTAGQSADFRRSPKRGQAWVDVQGGGLLQRVSQWTQNLASPFRQYNQTLTSIGYWPGEQDRGSTTLVSSTAGTRQAVFTDMAPDSQFRPPSSAPLLDFGDNGELGGYFVPNGAPGSTAGYQLSWVARYPAFVPGDDNVMDWATVDNGQWSVVINPTTGKIGAVGSLNGSVLMDSSVSTTYDFSQWTMYSVDAQYSAGTTTVWLSWVNADGTASGFTNGSFSGVPSALLWWDANVFEGVPTRSTIGHVIGIPASSVAGPVNLFGTARKQAWYGYVGERAGDRFTRLCAQFNLPYAFYGFTALSAKMGAQPVDTLAKQFEEIKTTEDGLIFDAADTAAVTLRQRNQRFNQSPVLTLDASPGASGMPNLPVEVTDDLPIHNIVTVSQRDGGDYIATDATSPMGTQSPPNGRGEYRQTVDVNLADPDNEGPQEANWWLRRGTVNLPRFPQVTVDMTLLGAAAITAVEAVDVGSVIQIVNYREYTIRLFVLGYVETIGTHTRSIVFTCEPDQQFNVLTLGTGRLVARTTTLNAGITSTATTLVTKTSDPLEQFRTGSNAVPVLCGGELITLGTVGAVTGTGPFTQTVTGCTRSVNGIVKAHSAGDPVLVSNPLIPIRRN